MCKPILLFQTRLVDRPLYQQMQENVVEDWANTKAEFAIALHGSVMSQEEKDFHACKHEWPVYNYCGKTNGFMAGLLYVLVEKFLASDADILGVMDDDAYYYGPRTAMDQVMEIFHDFQAPSARQVGIVGPISAFYLHWKYDTHCNDHSPVGEIDRAPWATYGSTFIHRRVFDAVNWRRLLTNTTYWWDFIFNMEARRQGYCTVECSPMFKHLGCKGKDDTAEPYTAKAAICLLQKQIEFTDILFKDSRYAKIARRMMQHVIDKRLTPRLESDNA